MTIAMGKTKRSTRSRTEQREARLKAQERKGLRQINKQLKIQGTLYKALHEGLKERLVNEHKTRCVPLADPIVQEQLNEYAEQCREDPLYQATANALASISIGYLAENHDFLKSINYAYSNVLDRCPRATSQAYSGRCWLFAALNMMRYKLIKNLNLDDTFELSEAYLFFFDKIERCHYFLQKAIELRDRPITDVVVNGMCTYFRPVTDGGTWQFMTNLITKYGIVPKSCYGESFNSSCTDEMNEIIYRKIGEYFTEIRGSDLSDATLRKQVVERFMPEIYSLVSRFMGEPPKVFNWTYHEAGDNVESVRNRGAYRNIEGLTPQLFYQKFIEPDLNIKNRIVLRHDPRPTSEYYRTYEVEHFGNMVGGKPDIMLNVPWEVFSRAAAKSILADKPVWFSADVCKEMEGYGGILSTEAYDYDSLLGTKLSLSKADALEARASAPTHAMALVGVDLVDGDVDNVVKWKVENSWGESGSGDPGYLLMTQEWFKKYGYEVVVDLDLLDEDTREAYARYEYDPIVLPYNDAFGAVARFDA